MVKKRSETVKMQTEPNSELPETPKTQSGKLSGKKVFIVEKKLIYYFLID